MTKRITLFGLVRQECCNYENGHCLGIDTTGKRFRRMWKCWIIDEGTQCDYFVECVLPLEPTLKDKYVKLTKHDLSETHKLNRCKCGVMIHASKRKCLVCRMKARRATNRKTYLKTKDRSKR